MQIDAAFFSAAYASPKHCLGTPLLEFSLGHQIRLKATRNAFDAGNPQGATDPQWEDLLEAVFICSQDWASFPKTIDSRWLNVALRFWGWRCARAVKKGRLNLASEMVKFTDYIKDAGEEPDINRDTSKGGRWAGSPWELRMKLELMKMFPGLTEEQILNRPLRQCNIEIAARDEMEGKVEIFNKDDEQLFKMANDPKVFEELEKRIAAEREVKV